MKNQINKHIFALTALCSLACCGAHALSADSLALEKSANPAVRPAPRTERWQNDHAKREARLQKGNADILLIGDSITHGWKKYPEVLKKIFGDQQVINLGHPADKTENIIWRLANHHMEKISPRAAIVLAGTNNSNDDEYSVEEIAGGVEAIIQILQAKLPDTRIVLMGIFPRGSREQRIGIKGGLTEATMNPQWEKIDEVNRIIETFADGKNIIYLNINQAFLNKDGALPVAIMPDLLHPNEKGFELWGNAMAPTLEKIMGNL
jgi:beta-glucosidase